MKYILWCGIGVVLVLTSGCSIRRMEAFVTLAEARQWKTCFKTAGAYGLFASASLEIAAGGATIAECRGMSPVRTFTIEEHP